MKSLHALVAGTALIFTIAAKPVLAFDITTDNGPLDIVINSVAPIIFTKISPSGGDATLVLRTTTLVTNAWYDATAAYDNDAVGVFSRFANRPGEATVENINTSAIYASYRVLNALLPAEKPVWDQMMNSAGLDPTDDSTDTTTPIGMGNVAGQMVAAGRLNDGMNQTGFADGRTFNPTPFADYTGYEPVNTAYKLKRPSRWQPDLQRQGLGLYKIQQFVTPQYALVEPYSYDDPENHSFPPPTNSYAKRNKDEYQEQADEVLQASADLTEEQKLMAELFDNKINSLGFSAVFAALSRGLSLLEFIQLDFLTNMAAFDAGISVWHWKREYDAVRPYSAIRYIYGDELVSAWGGPGEGTVLLPASEWKSYLEEADHPEYPSASSCFCAAHAQSARRFLGDDMLGFPVQVAAGSSRIEPGLTPAQDTILVFPTWSDFEQKCGQSRVWAGVHFQAAVDESLAYCGNFGDIAYDYMTQLLDGIAPQRGPSSGKPFKSSRKKIAQKKGH